MPNINTTPIAKVHLGIARVRTPLGQYKRIDNLVLIHMVVGKKIMHIGMILLGLLMVADGVFYFFGKPLFPIG